MTTVPRGWNGPIAQTMPAAFTWLSPASTAGELGPGNGQWSVRATVGPDDADDRRAGPTA